MKVLLAIDGSNAATHAVEFFCRLPHDSAIDIEVLSVINVPDLSMSTSTATWLPDYVENLEAAANATFRKTAKVFEGSNVRLAHHKTQGHVGNSIVHRASDIAADLIVMGAVGHSPLSRILLGSVSDFVATHAEASVLVVRPPHDGAGDSKPLRVTFAYDGSEQADRALDKFCQFSWVGSVAVEILTIVQRFSQIPYEVPASLVQQVQEERAAALEKNEEVKKKLESQHVRAVCKVTDAEHIGEAVVTAANENSSDLIVLGNTGRSLIPRLMLGSVSAYVLRHARQSVWIVR